MGNFFKSRFFNTVEAKVIFSLEMAVLGTLNFCMGVEILNSDSYRSSETCLVGAQKNHLIEMAVLSTPRFCLGVELLNTNSYRSFEACVVGAQNNRLIETAVLSTLNHCLGVEISNTNSLFCGMCCQCSREPSHRDGCFGYPQLLHGCRNFEQVW